MTKSRSAWHHALRKMTVPLGLTMGVSMLALGLAVSLAAPASAQEVPLAAKSKEKIFFRGWQFRTDVVQGNVDLYNKTMSGNVDYATVTGDYPSMMEQNLIAGGELDILYANPSSATRYMGGGWITPAETALPNGADIAADMYPNIRDAWSVDGKLLGLSYFTSVRGTLLVNLKGLQAAGKTEADFPTNWHDLYTQAIALHAAGVKTPYLPHWFGEYFGISWGFDFEVMNRGGVLADVKTHAPMLTVDGPAGDTLRDWKALWKTGAVPEEVLSYNEAAYIDAFRSGRYIYSPQQIYDIKTFNDKTQSADVAGSVTLVPADKQSWGLIDSAMYLITNRSGRSADATADAKSFLSWYGYKNEKGEFSVANRWLKENMLFSAYKSVMESDLAKQAIQSSVARPQDYDTLLKVYSKADYPKGIWNVVWSEEFNSWLRQKLLAFLQHDLPVDEVINEANAKIKELNEQYGL